MGAAVSVDADIDPPLFDVRDSLPGVGTAVEDSQVDNLSEFDAMKAALDSMNSELALLLGAQSPLYTTPAAPTSASAPPSLFSPEQGSDGKSSRPSNRLSLQAAPSEMGTFSNVAAGKAKEKIMRRTFSDLLGLQEIRETNLEYRLIKSGREKNLRDAADVRRSGALTESAADVRKPSPQSQEYSALSGAEKVQNILRTSVSNSVLDGTSFMVPTPHMIPDELSRRRQASPMSSSVRSAASLASPSSPKHNSPKRSTLFSHIAYPSQLPQSLCEDDVKQFRNIGMWEAHLKKVMHNSSVGGDHGADDDDDDDDNNNDFDTTRDLSLSVRVAAGSKTGSLDPNEACERASLLTGIGRTASGRKNSKETGGTGQEAKNEIEMEETDPPAKASVVVALRGRSMSSSLEVLKQDSVRRASVHMPDVNKVINGLSSLISYLIEEPSERCYSKQAWQV